MRAAWLLLASALTIPIVYFFTRAAAAAIGLPFDLENLEGELVIAACDVQSGLNPYPDALSPRMAFLYSPLFFWITALFTDCRSESAYVAARLVELASYLAAVVGLAVVVTPKPRAGIGLAFALVAILGLTLSQFGALGSWYFVARVDMLALALAIWAWVLMMRYDTRWFGTWPAGVLVALAIATKQVYLLQLPAMAAVVLIDAWTRRTERATWRITAERLVSLALPSILLVTGLIGGGGIGVFHYLFTLAGHHGGQPQIRHFWDHDLWRSARAEFPLALAYVVYLIRGRRRPEVDVQLGLLFSFVAVSYVSRGHSGGHVNVLIPAVHALTALAVGALWRLIDHDGPWARPRVIGLAVIGGLLVVGAVRRASSVIDFAIDPTSRPFFARFTALARDRRVLFSKSEEMALLGGDRDANRPPLKTIHDRYRVGDFGHPAWTAADVPRPIRDLESDVRARRYDYLILDEMTFDPGGREATLGFVSRPVICANYVSIGEITYPTPDTLQMLSGPRRPRFVWARAGDRARSAADFERFVPLGPGPKSAGTYCQTEDPARE